LLFSKRLIPSVLAEAVFTQLEEEAVLNSDAYLIACRSRRCAALRVFAKNPPLARNRSKPVLEAN
jgi:hypothetical protein